MTTAPLPNLAVLADNPIVTHLSILFVGELYLMLVPTSLRAIWKLGFALAICGSFSLSAVATGLPTTNLRPFGVRDSIERNVVIGIDGYTVFPAKPDEDLALYSPDRSHFIIRTREGNITNNVLTDSLYLFTSKEVTDYLAGQLKVAPQPKLIVKLDVRDGNDVVNSIRWVGNDDIIFVGPDQRRILQGWTVNVSDPKLIQLTHSPKNVRGLAVTGGRVVYFADEGETRPPPTYVSQPFGDYEFAEDYRPVLPFWEDRATGAIHQIGNTPVRPSSFDIWPSPDGRFAIAMQPVEDPPALWAGYLGRIPGTGTDSQIFRDKSAYRDPASFYAVFASRFVIFDLDAGTMRPLLDAPSGMSAHTASNSSFSAWWIRGGRSVIVANTYLPLSVSDSAEAFRRSREPAIAEVDLDSGGVTPIARLPLVKEGQFELRQETSWDAARGTLTVATVSAAHTTAEVYRMVGDKWGVIKQQPSDSSAFNVAIRQTLTDRPKLFASARGCNCEKLLLDTEPRLDSFSFGRTELVNWSGPANGRWDGHWRGELVYPVGYSPSKRYPLVVQTHGGMTNPTYPGEFLIDGPNSITTAMPAQALANSGIMVLQVFDQDCFTSDHRESFVCAEGYKNGIQSLVDRGLVDNRRVGMIAFSRTGLEIGRLLEQYPDILAAADISDAMWWGYVNHTFSFPDKGELAISYRSLTSGLDHNESIAEAQSDPMYKWSNSRAAIRLEANGPGSLIATWEAVSVLRAASHPVDFVYFPRGTHVLLMPDERMASQGGNVDWFRFWLQDYEDPDPSKREQFARWEILRQQRDTKASVH